ncbi:response regulator transcription factor [bacterium]|nr:response regulator transcription factor [bacterium]
MAKVLLVDDNSKYLKDALPFYGYEVEIALDGLQALKFLEKNYQDIDIILLDVIMPNMDGWQTLKAIRTNVKTKHLPVIMLTAINEDQKMVAGLKNGADDYIVKPFILPNLLARMEAVLRRTTLSERPKQKKSQMTEPLTAKEKEVLHLVSQGKSNKEIADTMFVKEVTVKTHLNSIFKKLKVNNRTQAVLLAMETL